MHWGRRPGESTFPPALLRVVQSTDCADGSPCPVQAHQIVSVFRCAAKDEI